MGSVDGMKEAQMNKSINVKVGEPLYVQTMTRVKGAQKHLIKD